MAGLFTPLCVGSANHIHRLVTDRDYRQLCVLQSKLSSAERFTHRRVRVRGWDLDIPDSASFLSAFKEIFVDQIYAFESDSRSPAILDLGANIGLSVLFFKSLYPDATITAFEADPAAFKCLQRNIHGNGFADVTLINAAVWDREGMLKFESDGADGGRVARSDEGSGIRVKGVDIAGHLRGRRLDFLKMDIEGAEGVVLPACKPFLRQVKRLFVEYHSKAGEKQCLDQVIDIMAGAGFRLHIHDVISSPRPFIEQRLNSGFDLQLNIFGWRE